MHFPLEAKMRGVSPEHPSQKEGKQRGAIPYTVIRTDYPEVGLSLFCQIRAPDSREVHHQQGNQHVALESIIDWKPEGCNLRYSLYLSHRFSWIVEMFQHMVTSGLREYTVSERQCFRACYEIRGDSISQLVHLRNIQPDIPPSIVSASYVQCSHRCPNLKKPTNRFFRGGQRQRKSLISPGAPRCPRISKQSLQERECWSESGESSRRL